VNLVWGALVILAATAATVTAMLLVRRGAPDGGYFNDGDRAAGVFGVLATGFSVLLGFLIFLAFESYDAARTGAEAEAVLVAQQIETAQRLPAEVSTDLTGQLVCYARAVINQEWDRMEERSLGEAVNLWAPVMFRTLEGVELGSATEEAAYGKWLDQTSDREAARNDRIHGAVGVIPVPLWVVLFMIGTIIIAYMLLFADKGEGPRVQAMLMGSVTATLVALLLLLNFLDQPFHIGVGGLQPVAMERTEQIIAQELAVFGGDVSLPCDDAGVAT
jgi:hypothetical protein